MSQEQRNEEIIDDADGAQVADEPPDAPEVGADEPPLEVLPIAEDDSLQALAVAADMAIPQEQAYRRVGVGMRVGAAIIDGILFSIVMIALWLIDHFGGVLAWMDDLVPRRVMTKSLVLFPMLWLLYTATEVFGAATPGKVILGVRIARTDFSPAFRRQRVRRWLIRRCAAITAIVLLVLILVRSDIPFLWRYRHALDFMVYFPYVLEVAVIVAFLGCAGRSGLSYYDRWLGTAVIHDMDLKRSKNAAFGVITPDRT